MLKKVLSIILAGILLITLTACSSELSETAKQSSDGEMESQTVSVISDQQKKEETEKVDDTSTIDSQTIEDNSNTTPQDGSEVHETTVNEFTENAPLPTQKVEEAKPQTKPTETQPVKPPKETTSETTTIPTTIPSSEATSQKDESTTQPETQDPEQTEPPQAFDIAYWVDYAQTYAKGKGLVLDNNAIDCWDNPIRAGAHCIYLERDIQSRLNRYAKDEDITDVWIWIESVGNDCYDIYIGYA